MPDDVVDAGGLARLQLDPRKANHIAIFGKKGSGKSVLAERFWRSYPGDRLSIDPTGDAVVGADAELLELPLPVRWPTALDLDVDVAGRRRKRSTLHYVPNLKASTYIEDMDAAAGLAYTKGHALLWLDEVGRLVRVNATPPHMREILNQSRHRRLSLLCCGPRPIDIDPLVISQADYVAVFKLPNPNDRRRVADVIGLDLAELEGALFEATSTKHGYVWWDSDAEELLQMPPLPYQATQTRRRDRFAEGADNVTAGL